jgi:DNA topoisomerase-6 subunit B
MRRSGRYSVALAEELAKKQRSISVAEFFEKNKHLLGFDSPTRGVITTIKEAVDNSLDACEEAAILPDIYISIRKTDADTLKVAVEDNGPGITPEQVPFVFGKLLYGSRFHQIKQTRGQQGIGISAAVLYGQLTVGHPSMIISRIGASFPAYRFLVQVKTESNEPEILEREEITWDRLHGTRVEIEFRGTLAAKKRLVDYLRYTSVVNPHARLLVDIEEERLTFERVSDDPIQSPVAIKPHPHGIEIGQLRRMTTSSDESCELFLINNFSRVGKKTACEICHNAKIDTEKQVTALSPGDLKSLINAMQMVSVPAPPASQCLSPIGEDLIRKGLEKEMQLDFIAARTRPAGVYSGHPFLVEAAFAYGGRLDPEGPAQVVRFANRVPLIYQPGACAITSCVTSVNWKSYGLSQQGLPIGPILILVHVASTNVPFTSESKDAIASIPEIERDIVLALQELGRDVKTFLSRRDRNRLIEDRARAVCAVIPDLAEKVAEIVELPVPDTSPIEGRIMKKCIVKKAGRNGKVILEVSNHSNEKGVITVYLTSPDRADDAIPKPDFVEEFSGEFTKVWQVPITPGSRFTATFSGNAGGSLDVRGIDERKKVVIDLDV